MVKVLDAKDKTHPLAAFSNKICPEWRRCPLPRYLNHEHSFINLMKWMQRSKNSQRFSKQQLMFLGSPWSQRPVVGRSKNIKLRNWRLHPHYDWGFGSSVQENYKDMEDSCSQCVICRGKLWNHPMIIYTGVYKVLFSTTLFDVSENVYIFHLIAQETGETSRVSLPWSTSHSRVTVSPPPKTVNLQDWALI